MSMKYNIACNDGQAIFYCSNGKKIISMEITDWPVERIAELSRIFNLR